MRLVTMNLWGIRGDWDARRQLLIDGLRELDPDLCTLQETVVTDDYDQVRDLLDDDCHVVHQRDREDDGQGISIASRWPIANVRELGRTRSTGGHRRARRRGGRITGHPRGAGR